MGTRRQPPQSARSRSGTMDQDRLATLPLHGGTRTKPRRLGADRRTIDPNKKPAGQLWSTGFFIVEARTALSADLIRWNVIRLAEQPPFCAGVEMGLNPIAAPLQSATPFRSWISI